MHTYQQLFARVGAWNALRYDRVFNMSLLHKLLTEEFNETVDAKTPVEQLDGRADQIYVALGGIWKLNLEEELIANAFGEAAIVVGMASDENLLRDIDWAIEANLKALVSDVLPQTQRLTATILATICLLNQYAIERDFDLSVFDVLEVVCDSNDSKQVQKVAPDVKANINKGAGFIAPEPRLQALIDGVTTNVKH